MENKKKDKSARKNGKEKFKRPYQSPKITVYGGIEKITGGTARRTPEAQGRLS